MNETIVKYILPVIAIVIIVAVGIYLFGPFTHLSKQSGNSSGCNIKYQPNVKAYTTYPSFCIDEKKTYTAIIDTNYGTFSIMLLPKAAPKTVNSFVFLSKSGFFNNLTFHRIIPGFVIQGGDPNGNGSGGPGYSFNDEINPKAIGLSPSTIANNVANGYMYDYSLSTIKITTGVVAMANSGPNTNGSQFFIALNNQPTLDGQYTAFGEVISGMGVVNKISLVPTDSSSNKPLSPVTIKSIQIQEK